MTVTSAFTAASTRVPYRLIWRSYGLEKTGKSQLGLTGPAPIAILSFDIGLEGVVEKFAREKNVRVAEFALDKVESFSQNDAIDLRDRFIAAYKEALTWARTVQIDTDTENWELFRYAEFGKASNAPKDYVRLNAFYRDLLQQAYDKGVNLQLIQKVKERWISVESTDREGRATLKPQNTGELEATGFRDAGYLVQANFEHTWDAEHGFGIHVLNCRQNMGVAGQTFYNTSFPELAQQIFTNSEEEDWQ